MRVAPPVLAEFFAVSTDPRRVSQPRSATDALAFIRELLAQPGVKLLATPADLVERWMALVERVPVTAQSIFDYQIVAIMLFHDVRSVYTYNRSDFERFSELSVMVPGAAPQG